MNLRLLMIVTALTTKAHAEPPMHSLWEITMPICPMSAPITEPCIAPSWHSFSVCDSEHGGKRGNWIAVQAEPHR
jgi:hypothetical protein